MNAALVITIGQLVTTLGPLALETILKIKALLAPMGQDIQMNVVTLADDAAAADADTIASVNAFLTANNLPLI